VALSLAQSGEKKEAAKGAIAGEVVGAGRVTGIVADSQGKAVPEARVLFAPEAANRRNPQFLESGQTDQNGRFALSGVPPGDYQAFAFDGVEQGDLMDLDFLKAHEGLAQNISVQPNSGAKVQLIAIPADETAPVQSSASSSSR
jgi:hypothetical protein